MKLLGAALLCALFAAGVSAQSPLVRAVAAHDVAAVRATLANGGDPNQIDNSEIQGWTPLMAAAYAGSAEIVQLLIQAHADVNAVDQFGATALDVARSNGKSDIAAIIKAAGGKARITTDTSNEARKPTAESKPSEEHESPCQESIMIPDGPPNMVALGIKAVNGKMIQLRDDDCKAHTFTLSTNTVFCNKQRRVQDWRFLQAGISGHDIVTLKLSRDHKTALVVWNQSPTVVMSMTSLFSGTATSEFPPMCK